MDVTPTEGNVLVELGEKYAGVVLVEKSYDSVTYGTVVAAHPSDTDGLALVGHKAYWRLFKDDCRTPEVDGKKYALVEINDIMGSSNADKSTTSSN